MVLDTRAILMKKALTLFADRGYDAVGVQEIVTEAGVTKPTLYHYFGSKRGLLDALLESRLGLFERKLAATANYIGDLTAAITDIVRLYMDFAQTDPTFFRMQRSMSYAPPDSAAHIAVTRYQREQKRRLEAFFISAVPDHGNLKGHHQLYALTLLGMVFNVIDHAQNERRSMDASLARQTVQQFMHGIYSL
ncbi:MAG: TetR/AcrR family transcriptional regulator [Anaerolineales bacterium]|nr:TetR/AcrR family transcriptional regulator [Anaerolineales bacterium]